MMGKIKFYQCNFNFKLSECKVKDIANANLVIIPNSLDATIFNRKYKYYFKNGFYIIPEKSGIFYLNPDSKKWEEVSENFGEIMKVTKNFINAIS